MPDPKVFVAELDQRSLALQKRLEKELARAAPASAAEGTAMVGGWAKIGGEIESLLSAVYAYICASERRDPEAEFRVAFPRVDLKKAGAGQLVSAIGLLAHLLGAKAKDVGGITKDIAGHPSKVKQLVDVRNKVVHDAALPSYEVAKATLGSAAALLRAYRKEAGFEPSKT